MSGEKTEQPTAKKLRDARKKGQVAKSQEEKKGGGRSKKDTKEGDA